MDLSAIRTALETWVESITGLDVVWRDRKEKSGTVASQWGSGVGTSKQARVLLYLSTPVTMGRDEARATYDDTAQPEVSIIHRQIGQRTIVLEVIVETHRASDDFDARHYTNLLRNRVVLPIQSTAVFDSADLSFNRIENEQDLTETVNKVGLSVAQMDIVFNSSSTVEDTPTTWIETAESTLEVPEGTPVWTGDFQVG